MAARPVQAAGLGPTVVQHVALLVPRAERDETAALTAAPIPAGVRLADAQSDAQALPQAERAVLHAARVAVPAEQRAEPVDEQPVAPIPGGARLADAQSDALPQAERAALHEARVAALAQQRAELADERRVAALSATPAFSSALRPVAGQPARG